MTRILVFVLVAALTGCAQPEAAPSPDLDPELGVGPTVSESEPTPVASPTVMAPSPVPSGSAEGAALDQAPGGSGQLVASTPSPTDAAPTSQQPQASPAPDGETRPSRQPVVLLAVADAAGDHGARGPGWADLRSIELVEVGNDLRVTLRFGGDLPAVPAQGEVPLIGIDIGDEGYQLFVEGGGESWAAHLDTPEGFVEYPGTFELAGRALVLQVPFSAVGSLTRAPVRVFAEWSRDSGTLGVLNPSSEDHLDGQPHTFDRAS